MDAHLKTKALPTEYNIIDRSINATDTVLSYMHFYDNNGNITRYCAAQGNVVASYTYDAFGNTIAQSGPMADAFAHRFSTRYFDSETGLYYYGYRYYSPPLMRWLNCDPIEEEGGVNLYAFASNSPSYETDAFGLSTYNIIDLLHDQMCEDAYRKIRSYLNTAQELAAWDRYTNHDGGRRFRDIELSPSDVKLIAESMGTVVSHVQAKRGACRQSASFSETKSIGGSAPSPWIKAIGGVSIKVSTSCSNGCFSYEYNISDLYDFDTKGFSGFKSRGFWGQVGTIGVNWTQTCLRCDWQTFYHKGTYYGK